MNDPKSQNCAIMSFEGRWGCGRREESELGGRGEVRSFLMLGCVRSK